jgi:hypothetical protein
LHRSPFRLQKRRLVCTHLVGSQVIFRSVNDFPVHTGRNYLPRVPRIPIETVLLLSTLYDVPLNTLFPQQVGALNACLKEQKRMLKMWQRTRQRSIASRARGL